MRLTSSRPGTGRSPRLRGARLSRPWPTSWSAIRSHVPSASWDGSTTPHPDGTRDVPTHARETGEEVGGDVVRLGRPVRPEEDAGVRHDRWEYGRPGLEGRSFRLCHRRHDDLHRDPEYDDRTEVPSSA